MKMYNELIATTNSSSMGSLDHHFSSRKNAPVQIDVTLAVEKEMTAALTGKVANPEKIVQKISDRISIVTQEGSSDVETLLHYQCAHCSENFLLSNKFKAHCLEAHGIANPYKCTECDNSYTNESAMRVHLRTHKNHKPYVCEECGRTFAQCSTWMAHVVRHSGATPHICEVCGKAFATKGDLATHSRIHKADKPFSCQACGLSFPRKSNYTRHMRTHTGEKPYSCKYCSKSFARSENCKEHERLHTKERPYACELCGMSFSDSGNFSKHKKNHVKKTNVKTAEQTSTVDVIVDSKDQLNTLESISVKEKSTKKTRREYKKKRMIGKVETTTASFRPDLTLAPPPLPPNKKVAEELAPPPPPSQPLIISLVRQPMVLTKPMPVSFNGIITVPLSEAEKNASVNGFIKLTSDNLVNTDTTTANDSCIDADKQPINPDTLMNVSESLKLPNYQFPVFVPSQTGSNPILTDLSYLSNSVDNQTFMMLDYTRDSSFSFTNDNSLILQENLFNRSPTGNLTGTDSFIYNGGLVPNELSTTTDHSNTCHMQASDFDIGTSVSSYFPSSSTTFDDGLEGQPLDTNEFLNEQYLVKTTKSSVPTTADVITDKSESSVLDNDE